MVAMVLFLGLYAGIYNLVESEPGQPPTHRIQVTERSVGESYCPAPSSGHADRDAIKSMESCEAQNLCLNRYDNNTGEYSCSQPIVWGVGKPPQSL